MSKKLSEKTRAVILNVAIVLGLVLSYFQGYPVKVIIGAGLFLLAFANIVLSRQRKRSSTRI